MIVFVYRVSWNVILSGATPGGPPAHRAGHGQNLCAGQHRVPVVAEILRKRLAAHRRTAPGMGKRSE